ncbi:MAG: hypothetical protein ACLTDV_11925 [Eubacterium sp.]
MSKLDLRNCRMLNELMVHLLSDIVARDEEGILGDRTCNGEEAYKMIKTKEPDVVLLDIVMPEIRIKP